MRQLFLLLILLLLLSGALGLRTVAECESDPAVTSRGDPGKMQCYHTAAITAAFIGDGSTARSICEQVWTHFGSPKDLNNDQRRRAELVSNSCYFDVARTTRDPLVCGYITQRDDLGTQLFGEAVTKDVCYDEVTNLAQLAPENYYRSNPNNICAIIFILPTLLAGAFIYSK